METPQLTKGQRVCLSGLTSNPNYNEREAVLEKWDAKKERWIVVLDDNVKFIVKPENLQALAPDPDASAPATENRDTGAARAPDTSAPESAPAAQEPERELDVPVEEIPDSKGCIRLEVANAERSESDGVTYFSIVVSLPEGTTTHSVKHRYNDILSFRNELAASQSLGDTEVAAPFPKKALLCKGRRLEERRQHLEMWLQKQLPEVNSFDGLDAHWCKFLSVDAQGSAQ